MSYEELDSIIRQANELGTYFFLYSGGEPLVRKKDIIRLCEAHSDCQFTAYKEGQPWNRNHLRPCPLLDNPQALVDAVERSGAHPTDLQDPENVRELAAKCEGPAAAWAPVAEELWACAHGCDGCKGCGQET